MTQKLLSDEELCEKLEDISEYLGCNDMELKNEIIPLINTQKRLYAEMVVGERKLIPTGPHTSYPSAWIDINNHITEQRARIK